MATVPVKLGANEAFIQFLDKQNSFLLILSEPAASMPVELHFSQGKTDITRLALYLTHDGGRNWTLPSEKH